MKIFKFDSDASRTEKAAAYFSAAIIISFIVALYGSLFQIFDNVLSRVVAKASAGWHTVGAVLIGATIMFFYILATDSFKRPWANWQKVLTIVALIVLTVASYCQFWFGDY